jgi:predicted RNA binding protein YcfA (HicA-like mRNA interferase family)
LRIQAALIWVCVRRVGSHSIMSSRETAVGVVLFDVASDSEN